jgi:hypothetical protein
MSKKESHRPKLRLVAGKMPSLESVRVLVPKIGYDEQLDCFYVDSQSYPVEFDVKTLPANFHTHELMNVDPSDVASLLAFQQEWGLVTTPDRTPLRKNVLGVESNALATPLTDRENKRLSPDEELAEAKALGNELIKRHPGLRLHTLSTSTPLYPFAPRAEVEKTVEALQDTVKMLVEAATEGYDEFGNIDYVNLSTRVGWAAKYISPYYPLVEVLPQSPEFDAFGKSDTEAQSPIIPLSIATLAQLLGYLTSDSGYRVCPHCHKYFMFKRHAHDNYVRNRRSEYCSDSCQNAAKQKRYQARKGA